MEANKIHNAIKGMKRLSIGIISISEMRWTDSGHCVVNNHQICHSGNPNGEHINGMDIILNETGEQCYIIVYKFRISVTQIDLITFIYGRWRRLED